MQGGGGRRLLEAALDLVPQAAQEGDVGGEFLLALALGVGADDVAARGRVEDAHRRAQSVPLVLVVDAAGHPDVPGLGHVHQVAAGNGDERGDARALAPQRLLRHLDEDGLALAEHLLDGHRRFPAGRLVDVGVGLGIRVVLIQGRRGRLAPVLAV